MESQAREKPNLKIAGRDDRETRAVPEQTAVRAAPRYSILRYIGQAVLPLLVIAAGLGAYSYLKATKPEVKRAQPRPTIFNVSAVPVAFATHQPELKLYGSVVAGRQVEIRALVAGQVVETATGLREGGELATGAQVIKIDPFDYKAAIDENKAQIVEAKARMREMRASLAVERGNLKFAKEQLTLAERDVGRAEPLSQRGTVSRRTLDDRRVIRVQREQAVRLSENTIAVWEARIAQQEATIQRLGSTLKRSEQRLVDTRLAAPFNAYVTDVGAQVGRMLSVNDRVATLIDKDWIEVDFTLTDQQFGRLVRGSDGIVGRKIEVLWNVGRTPLRYTAEIERLGSRVSSQNGGVQVFARVKNPTGGVALRPGAFVEVRVPDASFDDVARLPSSAIFNGDTLFVVEKGKLQERKIEIVGTAGADVLVKGNIKADERVMVTRLSTPGSGVRVKEIAANGG